ncbi:hypothetical protein Hdeb2414_s0002g00064151 [Helianthus debilis subsp. tardiflorus]
MRSRGVHVIANSILNATELDGADAALIDASHAVGHRRGYLECAQHLKYILDPPETVELTDKEEEAGGDGNGDGDGDGDGYE